MEQASAIYQAESAEEARQRLTAFAQQWRRLSAILSRPLPSMRWKGWRANSSAPPRCWSGRTASYFDFLNLDP